MSLKYFESISLEEQFKSMFDCDIVMLSHGAGEINLIYLKPYSVVIEGDPDLFFVAYGSTMASSARAYFIQLNNQNTSIKLEECTSMYLREGSTCKKKVIYTDLHISVDYIRSALNEAIRYLDSIDFDQYRPDSQFIL